MTKVWRINLKPAAKHGYDPRQFCLEKQRMGMGWSVPHQGPLEWEAYLQLARERYESKGPKKLTSVKALHNKVAIGDLCWTRDRRGNYYLGVVEGDWFYEASEENRRYDMVNFRPCRWSSPMPVDRVPGKVVNSFIGARFTLARIKDPSAVNYSQALANVPEVLGTPYDVSLSSARLLDLISWEDCEDLVGIYLQSQGYLLVPSSCKRSTVGYEYLLRHRENDTTAVAQIKKGKIDLNKDRFGVSQQGVDRVFLFTTKGEYVGEGDESVVCLQPEELTAFAQQHPAWMPPRIRLWMERLKSGNAALENILEEAV